MGESERGIFEAVAAVLDTPAFLGELDVLILNHAVQKWDWFLPEANELRKMRLGMTKATNFTFVDKEVNVNFVSFVKLATASIPALVRGAESSAPAVSRWSRIIVVSSGAGKVPCPKQPVYAGMKHGLHGFFDSLRLELEHKQ